MAPIAHEAPASAVEEAARAIEAQFRVAMGSETRVAAACAVLRDVRDRWNTPEVAARLADLASLVAGRVGPLVLVLFDLLDDAARAVLHPLPLLEPMLRAGSPQLVNRAVDALRAAVEDGRLAPDDSLIAAVAAIADAPDSPLVDPRVLVTLAPLFGGAAERQYVHSADAAVRRLAARVLDLSGRLPAQPVAAALLGESHGFVAPYLDFTRATHLDLLAFTASQPGEPPAVASLRAIDRAFGPPLLREAISTLGWSAINLGVEARRMVGVSIGGGLPLVLDVNDAALFDGCPRATRVFERTLLVAHGGLPEAPHGASGAGETVARFRACNLAHARVLGELLDLAPLTRERADRLVGSVGALVADFCELFPAEADECRRVRTVYEQLRARVDEAMARASGPAVPAEVTQIVQPFDDPSSPDTIRTLHGLKRYLHQRGLRLGLRLVQSGGRATRGVTLAVADGDRVTVVAQPVEYADFDPEAGSARGAIPYPVRVVADGFARQLLHGEEKLPTVRVFCYGNEVHYFVSYLNHPAFVRIDYSPPFAGGMIDLEYYGVSKYELSHHPNLSLDAVRELFRRLDFDVTIETTRVHARYDKERARDVADLCAHVESLFRLVPYLMDVDWALGNLDLPREARDVAVRAWADRVALWGVLPLRQMLSADRLAILLRDAPHPAGPRERTWEGHPPYQDRLVADDGAEAEAAAAIGERLRARGVDLPLAFGARDLAQMPFESAVLLPVRDAAASGRQHESSRLAAAIAGRGAPLTDAARLAQVLAPVDRHLQFETIGRVSGRVVQRAALALPDRRLSVALLRDDSGTPGLALVDDVSAGGAPIDFATVATLLRAHNFPVGDATLPDGLDAAALASAFSAPGRVRPIRPVEGERLAYGLRAAPGIAAGLARFGTARRAPADLDNAVLVTDRLSPDDSPFLVRAAAVVCTGGGVLSHAGLLAAQFGKPSVVIDARWTAPADAGARLQFWSVAYNEVERAIGPCTVTERRGVLRREEWLRDGDLVEVAADDRVVRVLGQQRDALALYDELRRLEAAESRLLTATVPEQILVERGTRAHALHQLDRLLRQLARADLAAFAVRRLLTGFVPSAACAGLLRTLLDGRAGDAARSCVQEQLAAIGARFDDAERLARQRIARSTDPFEVVSLRLATAAGAARLEAARSVLRATGVDRVALPDGLDSGAQAAACAAVDDTARARLAALRDATAADLGSAIAAGRWSDARHVLGALDRCETVVGRSRAARPMIEAARARLDGADASVRSHCAGRHVLTAADGGVELRALIGGKAAHLAEAIRLEPTISIPPWFAIANAAFQQVLDLPAVDHGGASMRAAIAEVISATTLDDRQRSRAIAAIWERLAWPPDLEAEIRRAYRDLSAAAAADSDAPRDRDGQLLVAVRSSAFEEDRPEATRAGEFDTFLFVAGESSLLDHVKRAWSGFWTARAIHNRAILGLGGRLPGGGILVQRIVAAHAAGVVQTIDVADARPWEMAIDVAFGLGEGVVSGRVAADHVTVVKGERAGGALRFHYATADKRERIVFDAQRGMGTMRADTLYHQRMRPALEYAELETLVDIAERLERAWREALDLEFAVDAHHVWVLQARPVPAYHTAWRETARHHPFAAGLVERPADPEAVA